MLWPTKIILLIIIMNKIIQSPLSDTEIRQYFNGKPNIRTMAEISQLSSLEQVFNGKDHCVVFTAVRSEGDGHWQLMFLNNDCFYFYDSYGMRTTELIDKLGYETFGQNKNLDALIQNSKYYQQGKAFYNNVQYQSESGNVQTCGRHIALVFILNYIFSQKQMEFNLCIYYDLMQYWKKKYNKNYDYIVSNLINDLMGEF